MKLNNKEHIILTSLNFIDSTTQSSYGFWEYHSATQKYFYKIYLDNNSFLPS